MKNKYHNQCGSKGHFIKNFKKDYQVSFKKKKTGKCYTIHCEN